VTALLEYVDFFFGIVEIPMQIPELLEPRKSLIIQLLRYHLNQNSKVSTRVPNSSLLNLDS